MDIMPDKSIEICKNMVKPMIKLKTEIFLRRMLKS
jgi:hypothetical protein